MARESTNLSNTTRYVDEVFPGRLLTDDDHPPHCSDLPKTVNQALELLFFVQPDWYPSLMKLWKEATCNYQSRQDPQRALETVVISKTKAIEYYSEAVIK